MPKDSYEIWLKALREELATAAAQARPLVIDRKYDEVEKLLRAVDGDVYGANAIADLYTRILEQLVDRRGHRRDPSLAAELFKKAFHWRRSGYPPAQTGMEADRYNEGVRQDRRRLIEILGYDPEV